MRIDQHDHGALAAALAEAWAGSGAGGPPGDPAWLTAVRLHDAAWRRYDRRPRWDAHGPLDFLRLPLGPRLRLYERGVRALAGVDALSAVLVSHHYTGLRASEPTAAPWRRREAARRRRLRARLAPPWDDPGRLRAAVAWLRYFDRLALWLPLRAEGAAPAAPWLAADAWPTPSGAVVRWRWRDAETVVADPFPFAAPLHCAWPERRYPRSLSPDVWRSRWNTEPLVLRTVRIVPAS